ncbi:MAG: type II toxin-antitoxin system VapC family toxin [Planctomycetaceae bacterium]|jgi:PIN domain nuclease of toxin-antitoxin system|nr:type II toxin-antitoxin system VapC family toxin [Planctomycetaceae bacterium]
MKLLLDTCILLKAATATLSKKGQNYISDEENELYFSSAGIWEVIIKNGLNKGNFKCDPNVLYHGLCLNGYFEIPISSDHTLVVQKLRQIHKDPFDRILLAQAMHEGFTFLTADKTLKNMASG